MLTVDGGGPPRAAYPGVTREPASSGGRMTQRVALITGCGKPDGSGQAIARALAADGAAVVVTDRRPTGVPNRRQEIVGSGAAGGVARPRHAGLRARERRRARAMAVLATSARSPTPERWSRRRLSSFGRLDILVNNAAAPQGLDRDVIDEIPIEVFDEVIRINLRGAWLMCRAAVPAMRRERWGRIINISSMAGVIAAPRSTPVLGLEGGDHRADPRAGDGRGRLGHHRQRDLRPEHSTPAAPC